MEAIARAQQQLQQFNQAMPQQHQLWLNISNNLQREATYRVIAQHQRDRAAMGLHGLQDAGNANPNQATAPAVEGLRQRLTPTEGHATNRAPSPSPGLGPTSNPSRAPLTPAEIQNIFRGADTTQATQTITNAMHRSASGASLAGMANLANFNAPVQPIQPGVTTPIFPGGSRHASRAATPDPLGRLTDLARLAGQPFYPFATQPQVPPQQSQGQPEVYILSSPTGPRGLLISNPDIYVTPPPRPQNLQQPSLFPPASRLRPYGFYPPSQPPNPEPQPQHQPAGLPQQFPLPVQQQGQPPQQPAHGQAHVRLQRDIRAPVRQGHPNNPGAGALVAAVWPHVWLIIRLVIFVWWFTSSDASWSRWLAMVAIAIIVFIVNTGILDGVVNQAWNPVRQHLEGLLPLGDANPAPGGPRPEAHDMNNPRVVRHEAAPAQAPDPAQVAARLVDQRRHDNANWLLGQVRRLERAGLLFLASIAPGVAERHIAHLEAQERAERQRREEAEEAAAREAAAAADAAAAAAAANPDGGLAGEQQPAGEETANPPAAAAAQQQQQQQQQGAPLIEI